MSTNGWLSGELFGLSQIQLVLSLAAVALCVVFPLVVCLLYCCCWRCLSKEAAPAAAAAAPAAAPDHELDLARGQTWQGDAILPGQPPPLDPAEEAAQVVIDMHSDKLIAINGQRLDARRQGIALPYAPNVSTVVTHNAPNVGAMRPPVEAEGRAYAIRGGDYADDGGGEGYVDGDGGGGGGEENSSWQNDRIVELEHRVRTLEARCASQDRSNRSSGPLPPLRTAPVAISARPQNLSPIAGD
ncbi:hypothetical protein T492DRAFT_1063593, partial [Pavlovales sp. CCMP2436]